MNKIVRLIGEAMITIPMLVLLMIVACEFFPYINFTMIIIVFSTIIYIFIAAYLTTRK